MTRILEGVAVFAAIAFFATLVVAEVRRDWRDALMFVGVGAAGLVAMTAFAFVGAWYFG